MFAPKKTYVFCLLATLVLLLSLACGSSVKITQEPPAVGLPSVPLFAIVPFNYIVEDVGDGWNEGWIALSFVNLSGRLLDPLTLPSVSAQSITVETMEGKDYSGQLVETPGNPSAIAIDGIDINESDVLPVPPGLIHWTTRLDYTYSGYGGTKFQIARYWIRFRFAYAAHPTRVRIQLSPQDIIQNAKPELVFDISTISKDPPAYEPTVVKPISELQNILSFDKQDKIRFQIGRSCLVTYDQDKRGWHLYLPYSAVNQNQLDQETETIEFGYALWFPYGAWDPEWAILHLELGPSQQVEDMLELESWNAYDEPLPQYLILYEPIGTYGTYQTVEVFLIQCEGQ